MLEFVVLRTAVRALVSHAVLPCFTILLLWLLYFYGQIKKKYCADCCVKLHYFFITIASYRLCTANTESLIN